MKSKFESLQVYRGLAAMLVVVHHISASSDYYLKFTPFNNIFGVGWCGVDFFFVLSGFIITHVHFDDIGESTKLLNYFKKRIIRIYPSYWIIATVAIIILIVSGKTQISGNNLTIWYVIKSYLLIPNVNPFLGVAWSLTFEIFFYIMFALLIWKGIRGLMFIILIYLFFLILKFSGIDILDLNFFLNGYHFEFIFGCLAALSFKYNLFKYNIFIFSSGICLFILAYCLCFYEFLNKGSIMSRLLFGLSSFVIISQSIISNNKINYKYLSIIGNASFSLYLIHPLIIPIFFKILSMPKFQYFASNYIFVYVICIVCFILCILTAVIYYNFIESRLTKALNKINENITNTQRISV